jgi:hypothetical protein
MELFRLAYVLLSIRKGKKRVSRAGNYSWGFDVTLWGFDVTLWGFDVTLWGFDVTLRSF